MEDSKKHHGRLKETYFKLERANKIDYILLHVILNHFLHQIEMGLMLPNSVKWHKFWTVRAPEILM